MSNNFRFDGSDLFRGLTDLKRRKRIALNVFADTAGKKMVNKAKQTALWTDRTANARQTMFSGYYWTGPILNIYISGGMDYSVYLELAHEKKYAVLWPTVRIMSPILLQSLERLLERING